MKVSCTLLAITAFALGGCLAAAEELVTPETGTFPRLVRSSSHAGAIKAVAFNREGSLFVTVGGMDQTLRIWSVASKALIRTIALPQPPETVAFVPGKPTVCAVGAGQTVLFYETVEGKLVNAVPLEARCAMVAFSPDGARMGVITSPVNSLGYKESPIFQLYDTETQTKILTRRLRGSLPVLAVARRAGVFAVPDGSASVVLLEAETGQEFKRIPVRSSSNRSLDFTNLALNSDASLMAVVSGAVTTFDVATGKQVRQYQSHFKEERKMPASSLGASLPPQPKLLSFRDVRFSGDDRFVVAGGAAVCIWRLEDGQEHGPFLTDRGSAGLDVCAEPAFVCSGSVPLMRGAAASPHLWEVASGRPVDLPIDSQDRIRGLAFSADETRLAVARGDQLEVWDFATGAPLLQDYHREVNAVAFSRDGKEVFSGGDHWGKPDEALQMNHLETFERRSVTRRPEGGNVTDTPHYLALAGCPATAQIALGGVFGQVLALYDTEQQTFMDLPVKAESVTAVALAPNGAVLAFATGGAGSSEVGLWHPRTAEVTSLWKFQSVRREKDVSCVAVDETGARVAAAAHLTLKVWNPATGKEIAAWKFEGSPIKTLAFEAATGDLLVGRMDGEVLQIDAKGQRQILFPPGKINGLRAMVLAQKRRLLALGGEDGNLYLLQLGGDRPREICRLYGSKSSWAVISPDGRFDTDALGEINALHWVFPDDPLKAVGVEVFMRDYYEPHLLQRVLANESLKPIQPLQDLNRAQPRLEVTQIIPQEDGRRVDVEVSLGKGVYGLQRDGRHIHMESDVYDVRLLRDGKLVAQFPEPPAQMETQEPASAEAQLEQWRRQTLVETPESGRRIRFEGVRLPAPVGPKIVFSAYAFNDRRVKSADARLNYDVTEWGAINNYSRAHLLCVGVSRYESPALNLGFAAADARALAAALKPRLERAGCDVNARLLISEGPGPETWQARRETIRLALQEIARQATPDDIVVISFSGHGYADVNSDFYLLPSDIGPEVQPGEKPSVELLQKCISGEDLSQWIRSVDAAEIIVIIDACHSAAAVQQAGFKPAPMGSRGLGQLAFDKRMRVLTATQADDFALEFGSLRQGLLTWALTQDGLEAGAADFRPRDGEITLGEWLAWGGKRVPELHQLLRTGGSVTHVVKGVQEKANLVVFKAADDGAMTRQLLADDEDDLKDSSLAKDRRAQSPQLFDFGNNHGRELVLERVKEQP